MLFLETGEKLDIWISIDKVLDLYTLFAEPCDISLLEDWLGNDDDSKNILNYVQENYPHDLDFVIVCKIPLCKAVIADGRHKVAEAIKFNKTSEINTILLLSEETENCLLDHKDKMLFSILKKIEFIYNSILL